MRERGKRRGFIFHEPTKSISISINCLLYYFPFLSFIHTFQYFSPSRPLLISISDLLHFPVDLPHFLNSHFSRKGHDAGGYFSFFLPYSLQERNSGESQPTQTSIKLHENSSSLISPFLSFFPSLSIIYLFLS